MTEKPKTYGLRQQFLSADQARAEPTDIEFFRRNPDRRHRLRTPTPKEIFLREQRHLEAKGQLPPVLAEDEVLVALAKWAAPTKIDVIILPCPKALDVSRVGEVIACMLYAEVIGRTPEIRVGWSQ